MMITYLRKATDTRNSSSLSSKLRRKRFALFLSLFKSIPSPINHPIKILDAGGRQDIWEQEGLCEPDSNVEILLVNIEEVKVTRHNVKSMYGDVTNLQEFDDHSFDVVYSNSVIEHLRTFEAQRKMAEEIRRVGKRYFVQTPNYYFPIEPHFLFPFFQFLPLKVRIWLVNNFQLGWYNRMRSKEWAAHYISEIRLLTRREMVELFPDARIYEEKFLGLTKSFIACGGWG